jgi:hypothetical protein
MNILAYRLWNPAWKWATRQLEEIFSDCFGIRLFGQSYLEAFAYIIAPGISRRNSMIYPEITRRVDCMDKAAEKMGVSRPVRFTERFKKQSDNLDGMTQLLTQVADEVSASLWSNVVDLANNYAKERNVPEMNEGNVSKIYEEFRLHMVPTTSPHSLVDVLNAGWRCKINRSLWDDKKTYIEQKDWSRILADLMLKSMEVAEIHALLEESNVDDHG